MSILFSMLIAYLIGAVPVQSGLLQQSYYGKGLGHQKFYVVIIGVLKGALATLVALFLGQWLAASFAAIFVVLGSMYSVFLGFRGDGGVPVAAGALLVLSPLLFLIGVAVFFVLLLATRYFDLSTLLATIIVMVISIFFIRHAYIWIGTISLGMLILFNQKIDWEMIKTRIKQPFRFKK